MNWDAITAITTLITTIIVAFTAIFAIIELNEMRRSRKLEVFFKLFEDFSSPKTREHRKYIYKNLPSDHTKLKSKHFLIIDDVLGGLDRAWLLIQHKQVDPEFIIDSYGEVFLRLWNVLYPIVLFERERRGDYYRERSEALINLIKENFLKHNRPVNYTTY